MSDELLDSDKARFLDLCLRNAIRYARGDIKYTMDLDAQLRFAYKNCNANTRRIMQTIFKVVKFSADEI